MTTLASLPSRTRRQVPIIPVSPYGAKFWIALFICTLVIPIVMNLGGFRLSAYRIVLLITLLPTFVAVLSGRAGRLRSFDILMILFVMWAVIAIFLAKGLDGGPQTSGIFVIETLGSYFLARTYI